MNKSTSPFSNMSIRFGTEMRKYAPLMILILLVIVFSILSPNFLTSRNLIIIIRQVSFAAISSIGILFVGLSFSAGFLSLSLG